MGFKATFNNVSVIEFSFIGGENHRPVVSHRLYCSLYW